MYNHAVSISFSYNTPHEDPHAVENVPMILKACKERCLEMLSEGADGVVNSIEWWDTYEFEEEA